MTVRIYQVQLTNTDNYGLDLTAVFNGERIAAGFNSVVRAAGEAGALGNLSMTLLKPKKWNNSTAIINALSSQGKTQLVTSSSVTTLNNKVAPVHFSSSQNYLKEITVTSTGSGEDRTTDTDYQVDTLNYGFTMEILPRILDHGRLIVLFNMSITDLVALEPKKIVSGGSSSGSSEEGEEGSDSESETTELQLPTMKMRGFVQEIAMRSGQTLVLTGFEDLNEQTNTEGIGKAQMGLLGGKAYNTSTRNVLVITMTPEVLQSPLSQEALMKDY